MALLPGLTVYLWPCVTLIFDFLHLSYSQADHLSGKPENVREVDICQGIWQLL